MRYSSPWISTSKPVSGENNTVSPASTVRTVGPTAATSAHTRRRDTSAVAGMRMPALDFRSPASFDSTTSRRSATIRIECFSSLPSGITAQATGALAARSGPAAASRVTVPDPPLDSRCRRCPRVTSSGRRGVPRPEHAPKEAVLSRSYRRVALPVLLLASLAFTACGGGGGGGGGDTRTAVDGKVEVNAKDPYSFDVKTINAQPGPLTITLNEKGSTTHTLTIPSEDFELKVTPGNPTATGTVTLEAGKTYDFKCTFDGHAAAGMTGKIVVS